MKNNPMVYYQLKEIKMPLAIYYAVLIALFGSIALSMGKDPNGMIGGLDGMTLFFILILGPRSFKECFRLAIQNGVSRKDYYKSLIMSAIVLSVAMALLDTFLGLVLSQITTYESLFYQVNQLQDQVFFSINFGLSFLSRVAWNLFAFHLGHLVIIFFYKRTRFGAYLVSISLALCFFVLLPLLRDNPFHISKEILSFIEAIWVKFNALFFATPFISALSWLFFSAIMSMGIYQMIRKTELKKHQ